MNYDEQTNDELREELDKRGVDYKSSDKKADLVKLLKKDDKAREKAEADKEADADNGDESDALPPEEDGDADEEDTPDAPAEPEAEPEAPTVEGSTRAKGDAVDILKVPSGDGNAIYVRTYSKAEHGAGFGDLANQFCKKDTQQRPGYDFKQVPAGRIEVLRVSFRVKSKEIEAYRTEHRYFNDRDANFKDIALRFAQDKQSHVEVVKMRDK